MKTYVHQLVTIDRPQPVPPGTLVPQRVKVRYEPPMLETFQGVAPVIHPSAFVHPQCTIIGKVVVGPESSIWPHVTLRGDDGRILIGAQTSIQDGSVVH